TQPTGQTNPSTKGQASQNSEQGSPSGESSNQPKPEQGNQPTGEAPKQPAQAQQPKAPSIHVSQLPPIEADLTQVENLLRQAGFTKVGALFAE
ncbi:hypothetical protein ABTH01_19655, partial [Acinetobacter baumannii]